MLFWQLFLQGFISKLLDKHHGIRLLMKVLGERSESGFIVMGSQLFTLDRRLQELSRSVEEFVSALQATIPQLNQARVYLSSNSLNLVDEVRWAKQAESMFLKMDKGLDNLKNFSAIMAESKVID